MSLSTEDLKAVAVLLAVLCDRIGGAQEVVRKIATQLDAAAAQSELDDLRMKRLADGLTRSGEATREFERQLQDSLWIDVQIRSLAKSQGRYEMVEPFPEGSNSGLVRILWNIASPLAEFEQKRISRLLARGLKDDQVIAWLPAGEVPKVAVDHFVEESRVPVALGGTVFGDPDFWQAIRSHAANAGLTLLRTQAGSVRHEVEQGVDAGWCAGLDGVIRNTKHRNGPLMAPYRKEGVS